MDRVISEYNSVFMAGWSTLECAGSRDVSLMFLSEMPFGLIKTETVRSLYSRARFNLIGEMIYLTEYGMKIFPRAGN